VACLELPETPRSCPHSPRSPPEDNAACRDPRVAGDPSRAASHAAGPPPQEQPPCYLGCRSLPAPAPRCQTLPETSLQVAACAVGPRTLPQGDPRPRAGAETPAPELPAATVHAGTGQDAQPSDLLPRQCCTAGQRCVLLGLFYNKSGFFLVSLLPAWLRWGLCSPWAEGEGCDALVVTGCQASVPPGSAPAGLPRRVRREPGAAVGFRHSWGQSGAGSVRPAAPGW